MKKIAILATYVGEINRGAETFVIEFVNRMKIHYDIDIFSIYTCQELGGNLKTVKVKKNIFLKINEYLYNKLKIYRKICNKTYFFIPDVLFQKKFTKIVFQKYIKKDEYDLIFPNNGVWGARFSNDLRKENKTPYIYTGHGGIGTGERYILNTKPNKYIALTEKHLEWAKKYSDNVIKIYNGIDVNKFGDFDQEIKEKKVILSVGALTEFKRHELTIDAIKKMDDKFELIIVGDGELKEKIKKYGKEALGHRFKVIQVPYDKMNQVYKKANLFVLPSLDEPFGIVYLEAMASNLPIVAPNDETRNEIIGEAGLYCNCEDSFEYSQSIIKALNIDWGNIPKERAIHFNWDNIITQYRELIEETINENNK